MADCGWLEILRLRGIGAPGPIPSDDSQFSQHGEAISEDADFRAWLIRPIHRNLCDVVSSLLRHVEQFEIEAITINGGDAKEVDSYRSTEQLESALRIGDPSEAALAYDEIEQVAKKSSIEAGLNCIVWQSGSQCTRSDSQIGTVRQGLFEPGKFLNRRGPIGIGKQLELSGRGLHAPSHGGPFPLSLWGPD